MIAGAATRGGARLAGAGVGTRGRRYPRLRGVDRMYLAIESPATPMHFGALLVLDGGQLCDLDGRLRLADIRRALDDRVAAMPELRRVIHRPGPLAGAPLWIDDPAFRVENHVAEVGMPDQPARDGEEALLRFAESLMASLLDRSHPLWRVWFITRLPAGRLAVLVVVHHALADGLAAMRLARSLLGAPSPGVSHGAGAPTDAVPPPPDRHARAVRLPPRPRWRELALDNARALLATAGQLARPTTWRAVAQALRSFRVGMSATRHEPRSSLNAPVGPRRRLAVLRLDPVTARHVGRAHDVGVDDVVLELVAGGLRALLRSRGEPIERLTPRAGIAVALPAAGRSDDTGNHFGSFVVPLPVGEPDPIARLRRIGESRARAKRAQAVTQVTGVRVWTARFAPTRYLMSRQRFINVMETYLPGPPSPIELLGAPVLDIVPIQPLGRNVGLTFLASSYAGRLNLTVRVDDEQFPDLDVLLAAMERDWRVLADAQPPGAPHDSGGLPPLYAGAGRDDVDGRPPRRHPP